MLPPTTEQVWGALHSAQELSGFVLVGGSALALRIEHRTSEDLDFVWLGQRLPSQRIELALAAAEGKGLPSQRHDDPGAIAEFFDSGLELHDSQQDYLVNGVKVSFFTAPSGLVRVLSGDVGDGPRVATIGELFATKCLVSAVRSRSRDWFDLYVLLRDHGFTLRDYLRVFEQAGDRYGAEIGLSRLCSGRPERADEGFQPLGSPSPSIEELQAFFVAARDALEVQLAAEKVPPEKAGS